MAYSLKMFDSKPGVIVVHSSGYASIVPHSHEFVEMVYVRHGDGMSLVGSSYAKLHTGDFFIIADRAVSHSIQPMDGKEDMDIVNVIFPYEYFDFDWKQFDPLKVVPLDRIVDGERIIEAMEREYADKLPFYEKKLCALAQLILTEYRRQVSVHTSRNGETSQKMQISGYIEKAVNYIHENYDRPITVDEVAGECGLCKAYLQRIFKRQVSTTIKEYIIKYRIEQSCKLLLSTNYSVATIAEMVGFFNLKHFYNKFKEIVGDSPRNYQAAKGGIK